jgi:hypothetical protein
MSKRKALPLGGAFLISIFSIAGSVELIRQGYLAEWTRDTAIGGLTCDFAEEIEEIIFKDWLGRQKRIPFGD